MPSFPSLAFVRLSSTGGVSIVDLGDPGASSPLSYSDSSDLRARIQGYLDDPYVPVEYPYVDCHERLCVSICPNQCSKINPHLFYETGFLGGSNRFPMHMAQRSAPQTVSGAVDLVSEIPLQGLLWLFLSRAGLSLTPEAGLFLAY